MYKSILENISKHILLETEEADYFTGLLSFKEVPRRIYILSEGQACNYLSYIHSGAFRVYYLDENLKELTVKFAAADSWVTDMYCFLNRKPANLYIEAIDDSCIYQLSAGNMDKLLHSVPKFERFFRILSQNAFTREQFRTIETLSLSAEERYDSFLKTYPQITKVASQKQIASYLGITPEFLSVLRKEKTLRHIS
ncbi:MAG TPA: Crp/Fnr family transcriptional regulator [Chitinophagaceae bacterium]|jgi:CRP-like cAMP-binding protein|nr:Crp/Fnr family transcriptional regulator [Chitinophagaceae bacterium]